MKLFERIEGHVHHSLGHIGEDVFGFLSVIADKFGEGRIFEQQMNSVGAIARDERGLVFFDAGGEDSRQRMVRISDVFQTRRNRPSIEEKGLEVGLG